MGMRRIPFLDLTISDPQELEKHLVSFSEIIRLGPIISGPAVEELEQEVAKFCGREFAIGVNSGTSALILALQALGIGHGDEVIVPCLSWIATANAVALVGAQPVFANIQNDLNICPNSIEKLISTKVKAIVAVDFTGMPVKIDAIEKLGKSYGIPVIEDAAQAFGAGLHSRRCGAFGDISCFSLNPVKIFGGLGEAGIVLTDDSEIATKLDYLRNSGLKDRQVLVAPSFNSRMDTIQASFLLNKLPDVETKLAARRVNGQFYLNNLTEKVTKPLIPEGVKHSFYTFTIQSSQRDELRTALYECGVETQIQHPLLMNCQPAYKTCRADPHIEEELTGRILCLPISERLQVDDLNYVVASVNSFFGG